jgi:hypothetical protein
MASNCWLVWEYWIGKDVNVSGRGLISGISQALTLEGLRTIRNISQDIRLQSRNLKSEPSEQEAGMLTTGQQHSASYVTWSYCKTCVIVTIARPLQAYNRAACVMLLLFLCYNIPLRKHFTRRVCIHSLIIKYCIVELTNLSTPTRQLRPQWRNAC